MKGTLPMRSPSGTATSVASPKPAAMRHKVGPRLWMSAPPVMLSPRDCAMVLTFGMETGSIHLCPDAYSHSRRITTIRRKPGQRLVTGIATPHLDSRALSGSGRCGVLFLLHEDAGEQFLPQFGESRIGAGCDLIAR